VNDELQRLEEICRQSRKKWQPPLGPCVIAEDYRRLIELAEALPTSRSRTDKTWVGRCEAAAQAFFRSAVLIHEPPTPARPVR
jgi:hypothetical protein